MHCIILAAALAWAPAPAASSGPPTRAAGAKATVRSLCLPLSFEANRGQFDPRVRFISRSGGATTFLTDSEAVMVLPGKPIGDVAKTMADRQPIRRGPGAVLRMKLVGAAKAPASAGAQRLPGISNYFIGKDPKRWRTNIPTYRQARFASVYPGTDLVYYGNPQRLEYDFELKPGADPKRIRLAFAGAERLRVAANGDLIATTSVGDVCWKRPFAYQMDGARRVQVACDYSLAPGSRGVGFRLARYDASRPLVVDPALTYSTFLGGNGSDIAYGVAVDSTGATYLVGTTASTNFPTTAGAYRTTLNALFDVSITKLNAAGTALTYSTYLGGNADDHGTAITVNYAGAAYITGYTGSTDFPTTAGALRTTLAGGTDGFITKLNVAGSSLTYSTLLGGTGADVSSGLAVDASGAAYVTGNTASTDFPVTSGAAQTAMGGGTSDAFVSKLNATGAALTYSTYLGGSSADLGYGIAVDSTGAAFVTGATASTNFPVSATRYQAANAGNGDVFVAKLSATGAALVYSTYLGGAGNDEALAIAIDSTGAAYVTGDTGSAVFPTSTGAYQTARGAGTLDVFVTKMNAAGSALTYSTLIGASSTNYGRGIAVDSTGAAWITGWTNSALFPTTAGAFQTTYNGGDVFLTKLNATGTALSYSTLLGGSGTDIGEAIALDSSGTAYAVGFAGRSDFPTTIGAYNNNYGGALDAFLARVVAQDVTTLAAADLSGEIGATVTLSATLTSAGTGVSGKSLAFTVDGVSAGSATSNASGIATRSYTISGAAAAGSHTIGVAFTGDSAYLASSGSGTLTVTKRTTVLAAANASGEIGATVTLSATLTAGGTGLASKTVAFTVGGVSAGSGTTNASGVASVSYTIPAGASVGTQTIGASFAADATYAASAGSGTLTINKHTTSLAVANVTSEIGATTTLSATLTAGGSGLPGKSIDFTVGGVSAGSGTTNASGVASVSYAISDAASVGSRPIGAAFTADATATASSGSGTLTINKRTTALAVASVSGEIGATVTLSATLSANGAGLSGKTVAFTVGGASAGSATTNASGIATLSYAISAGATVGSQTIGATFTADTTSSGSTGSGTLTVSKITTALVAADVSGEIGATVTLSATLTARGVGVSGKTVAFTINSGTSAGSATTDASGIARLSYTIPRGAWAGQLTIRAAFTTDATYAASSGSATLTVNKITTALTAADVAGKVGAYITLTASLTAGGSALSDQTIAFTVGGVSAGSAITDRFGVATLSYMIPSGASVGTQAIVAAFTADATYAGTTGSGTLTVSKRDTMLAVVDVTGRRGRTASLTATLTGPYSPMRGKSVTITLDGTELGTATTDVNGDATVSHSISADATLGAHTIGAVFAEDANSLGCVGSGTLTVNDAAKRTRVFVASRTAPIGSTVALGAELFDATQSGVKLSGKTIAFQVDGVAAGSAVTQPGSGGGMQAVVSLNTTGLSVGLHTITATFGADADYDGSSGSATLTVTKITTYLTAGDVTTTKGTAVTLRGTLSRNGGFVAGASLAFSVDGTSVGTGATNASGVATLSYTANDSVGAHTLVTAFAGDATLAAASATKTLTVNANPTRLYVAPKAGAPATRVILGATLYSGSTRLDGKSVTFSIDGTTVGSATTSAGVAALSYIIPDALGAGSHTITADFAGDADYAVTTGAATLDVARAATYLDSADVTAPMGETVTLRATLSRMGGYVTGATLTFKVDGTSVGTGTTGASGIATLRHTVAATPGVHSLAVDFAGDATNEAASATQTLTVQSGTPRVYVPAVSKAYYDAALIGGQLLDSATGEKLNGKSLTIEIDGTSIGTATTSGGQGTVSYTIPTTLAVGDHTIRVSFAGDTTYAASAGTGVLTIDQATPRLTVTSPTVAAGGKVQLVAVLTRNGGYAPGQTLTFKVDGTTVGTATTNAGGKGMIIYTAALAAGSHTLTVEFAGDTILKPITAAGTLTVTP